MARIPEAEIARIKREVSVQRLVEAFGVMLTKSGKDLIGLCPFHDDHHPSLRVTPSTNLWRCPPCDIGIRRECGRFDERVYANDYTS